MNTCESELPRRQSIRLKGYDYSQPGAYFVTICAREKETLFGDMKDGALRLSDLGQLVWVCWNAILEHFVDVQLDEFVVMPNHIHGILVLDGSNVSGAACCAPTRERANTVVGGSLSAIVRSFKSAVTKRSNELRGTPGALVWQRNFHERVIRNEEELRRIREYILNNPVDWDRDEDNPARKQVRSDST